MKGKWMWMPYSLLGMAQGFSGGCTCGFTEDEGTSVNMFVLLFLMCIVLVCLFQAFLHRTASYFKKEVVDKTPDSREKTVVLAKCEVCNVPSKSLPFDQCRTCGANPSFHHGRCCPSLLENQEKATEVNPPHIYVCASPQNHAYHLSENCPAIKGTRTKQRTVRCDICKTCESMSAKKTD